MSRGKHLSLEEARKTGDLKQFAKEHPSEADHERFTRVLNAMSKKPSKDDQTSDAESSGD